MRWSGSAAARGSRAERLGGGNRADDGGSAAGRARPAVTGRTRAAAALALVAAGVGAAGLAMGREGDAAVDGALVYARRCAFCHDVEGQVGAEITAASLASRGDEETLTRYLRLAMPYEAPGTMTDAEYRATARYLLETRGLANGSGAGDADGEETTTGDGR